MTTTFAASLKVTNCININKDRSATIRFDTDRQQLAKLLAILGADEHDELFITMTVTNEYEAPCLEATIVDNENTMEDYDGE